MILTLLCSCKTKSKRLSVFSADGMMVAKLAADYDLKGKNNVYCDIAVNEAAEILAELLDCNTEKAKKLLWKKEYTIYTYFDMAMQSSLSAAFKDYSELFNCASSVTDLNGNLIAAYSNCNDKAEQNYALNSASPYSSIKPLSVYSQAIEKGTVNWSTVFEDSPYKQVTNSQGVERGWPTNSSGKYSNVDVTLYEALQKSLNTVSVKCLKTVGVNNSIGFLQNEFGIPLSTEQYNATLYGEDEVLGNIALGYLTEGVTTVDMAGYYQIFATGGRYETPKAVQKLCDKDGKAVYQREHSPKEVLSTQTADIMNYMLQGVTKSGGTASGAFSREVQTAGKTGTGDNNTDCWFVGITPGYSCAVWHGYNYKNVADEIFSEIFTAHYTDNPELEKEFNISTPLKSMVYCEESGMLLSATCTSIQLGYYAYETKLDVCNKH